MVSYDTLVEGINDLKKRGFRIDLSNQLDKIGYNSEEPTITSDDFVIIETYRFEGRTNPSDEDILFAMISKDGKIKGYYSCAYGLYGNDHPINMLHTTALP